MGGTAAAAAAGGSQAVSTGYDIYSQERDRKAKKEDAQSTEQDSMRREANRRQDRALLLNQIEHFYNSRGIPLPTNHAPGEGTYRPLPGDKNPYAGYDVDPSRQTHQPLDAEGNPIAFDPNSPDYVSQTSDAQQALSLKTKQSQIDPAKAAQVAGVFHGPDHKAKVMNAELGAQAADSGGVEVPDPIDTPQQTPVPRPITANTTTSLPQLVSSVGRRYGY